MERDRYSRRFFLTSLGIIALSAACESSIITRNQSPKTENGHEIPRMGDVLMVRDQAFLLRNNQAYQIPDIQRYRESTKMDKYGRKVFNVNQQTLNNYQVSDYKIDTSSFGVIDEYTGDIKDNKNFGGEINVFFQDF